MTEAEELLQFLHECADGRIPFWQVVEERGCTKLSQTNEPPHRTIIEALRAFKRDELKKDEAA